MPVSTAPREMIAGRLSINHAGWTLRHEKRQYVITKVTTFSSYVLVEAKTARGTERLALSHGTVIELLP